jgi:glutathione S-transferase
MKLYYSPGACSLSPHIALREAGLDFVPERVDLGEKRTESGADFRAINPKGYVPALQLNDGTVLTEGTAIVQYIADQAPAGKLAPAAGTFERYKLIEWLGFISSELHRSYTTLYNPAVNDEVKQTTRTGIANRLAYVAKALEGRDYLMGAQFTVADGYLFTVLNWSGHVNISLANWPVLQAYVERVGARPAVQQAMRTEGLIQ